MSFRDLASQGITGMGSRTTIAKYRKAWKLAIERGFATDVKPGDLIDLPDNNSVTSGHFGCRWRVFNL